MVAIVSGSRPVDDSELWKVQSQAVMELQFQRLTVEDRRDLERWRRESAERVAELEGEKGHGR